MLCNLSCSDNYVSVYTQSHTLPVKTRRFATSLTDLFVVYCLKEIMVFITDLFNLILPRDFHLNPLNNTFYLLSNCIIFLSNCFCLRKQWPIQGGGGARAPPF